jgi:hypothetical protein
VWRVMVDDGWFVADGRFFFFFLFSLSKKMHACLLFF